MNRGFTPPKAAAFGRLLPITLIALIAGAVLASGLWRELSLARLEAHHAALKAFVADHAALGLAIYAGAVTLVVATCLPGMSVLLVAGGYLFGTLVGGGVGLAAATAGSALVFLAARLAVGDRLARRAGPRLGRLEATITANAFAWLLTLRLVPAAPYFVATLAGALARVRLRDLLAATAIGSAPVSFLLAGLGAGLDALFARGAPMDASLFGRPRILLPLAGLAVLSAAPWVWRAAFRRTGRSGAA